MAEIKSSSQYRVELRKAIKVGRATVTPGPNVRLMGEVLRDVLEQDATAVERYEEV